MQTIGFLDVWLMGVTVAGFRFWGVRACFVLLSPTENLIWDDEDTTLKTTSVPFTTAAITSVRMLNRCTFEGDLAGSWEVTPLDPKGPISYTPTLSP